MNAATMGGDVIHELAHGASDTVRRERFGERRLPNGKEAVGRARQARARQIGFTRRPIAIETEREHDHAGFAPREFPSSRASLFEMARLTTGLPAIRTGSG